MPRRKIPISGTFSTSWKLESTVRNRLFGKRLFFSFLIFISKNTVAIRSLRISANAVTFRKEYFCGLAFSRLFHVVVTKKRFGVILEAACPRETM